MKKIILLFLVCFSLVNSSYSQNFNWIIPNKTYLKLYVKDEGINRINKSDFTNAGVNTIDIDPRTIKVLYKGNQIPIYFKGDTNGVFDDNDFFDFYGKRNNGGMTPYRDGFSNSILYTTEEYYNLYSDTSVYWVEWGKSNGLRMQTSEYISSINYPDNYSMKKVHFEKDTRYYLGQTSNANSDFRYFSTERVAGESWFWILLTPQNNGPLSLADTIFISDLASTSSSCSLKVLCYPSSTISTIINEHRVEVKINNTIIDTLETDNFKRIDTTVTFPVSLLNNNSINSIQLNYVPIIDPGYTPSIYIDYFELSYPRGFILNGNATSLSFSGSDSTSKKISLAGHNSGNQTNIYDINNHYRIENFSGVSGTLTFTGKSNSSFEIINNDITKKPFRIITKQVKDLVSTTNRADYILVYNKMFESQSEQLKNHRQSFDSYRVIKADIEDIYDIFNYGMEDPIALRYFIRHANENWQLPKAKYVCLFGRASLDPKKSNSASDFYKNLIPTYGNPPTDGYFVNFNMGTFTYYRQISIGRLPVYTSSEAQDVVDKIINYDFHQPEKWWKKNILISGGPTPEEQSRYQLFSNTLINNYISPPPISSNSSRIYRNDSSGYITYNYKDSIKREFDRGAMIVNFVGHAASQDWEIGLEDPNTLNNGNKLPLVLSMTCFTGRNAEPNYRSFGEKFITYANKCAIGFIGTTGWSFVSPGNLLDSFMLQSYSKDSIRSIGEILSKANKKMSGDSSTFTSRNMLNCYNLLGDPATKLLIPRTPEFDIRQNDYSFSNPFPALRETINLTIFPKNLGTFAPTFKVRFRLLKNGITSRIKDTVINSFSYIDTILYSFSIDTIGNYSMGVILDPNHSYSQRFTNNDSINIPLTLRNLSYVPIKPLNNSQIKAGSLKVTGLNPNVDPLSNSVKIVLQVDTSETFNSPAVQTFNNNNLSGVATSFNVNLPVQIINTLYYFRTNAVINNDSSGWSETQKFIYNPNSTDNSESALDSSSTIFLINPNQYNNQDLSNVHYDSLESGFKLSNSVGTLACRSFGSNGPEASFLTVNEFTFYTDAGNNKGLNIAKVKKLTGRIDSIKNFRMTTRQASDSIVDFLNAFDSTDYLLLYMTGDVVTPSFDCASDTLQPNAKAKIRQFGSVKVDSIYDFCRFTTWVLIGYLGASPSQVCEGYHSYFSNFNWEPVECEINPIFHSTSGAISQTFGPSHRWNNFSWEQSLPPSSKITFDVFGIGRDNIPILLYLDLTNNSLSNLDTVDYYLYPNLKLDAKLSIDTISGFESPVFKSLKLKYIAPSELVPDNNSLVGGDTSVQEGDSLSFKINYYNVGYVDAQGIVNKWFINRQNGELVLKSDTVLVPLQVDSMRTSQIKFSTAGLRDPKITHDTINLYFETTLLGNENEIFSFNNTAITKFAVTGDSAKPLIDVTYDGTKIMNGDYVQSKPMIVMKISDDSRMVIRDTSNVRVYLDTQYVPFYLNGIQNPIIDISFPDDRFLQATVTFKPTLDSRAHQLKYVASDATGNFGDTIIDVVIVDDNMKIYDMANYPNPMQTQTNFMFRLSGESNPTTCKVNIYTVAGRLIKEINAPAIVGYNNIPWDGTDNDGDYIANGTYLYKFIIQGNSKIETVIQKLAILK